jgi:hypothetical protein
VLHRALPNHAAHATSAAIVFLQLANVLDAPRPYQNLSPAFDERNVLCVEETQ